MWCAATSACGVCAYMCIMECKTNEQNQIAQKPVHSIATLGGKTDTKINSVRINHIQNFNTSRGHLCILSRKYFLIASLDREKSENHSVIHFMHLY